MSIYDQDTTSVNGIRRLHSTLQRDWVCGICGGRLVLRWFEDSPMWRTVCMNDQSHHPDNFVHKASWAYIEAQHQMDHLQAQEIFSHLPPELKAAIETERS